MQAGVGTHVIIALHKDNAEGERLDGVGFDKECQHAIRAKPACGPAGRYILNEEFIFS